MYFRVSCRLLAGAMATSMLLAAPLARAEAESDAKDLFARGREQRAQGNCAGALMDFKKAVAIFPSGLGSVRNIAECEEQLGHFATSRRTWLDLKRALLTTRDRKYDGWDVEADAAAARLAPKVAKLTIDVVVAGPEGESRATQASGVEVLVNGEALPASLVGTPLDRDPGSYRIRVARPGGAPVEQTLALVAGEDRRVKLRVEIPARATSEKPSTEDPNGSRRLAGWITLAVGGAALVGTTVAFAVRQSAAADLESGCPNHEACDPALQSTVDRGKTAATLTNVFGAIGVLGVGAGIALILTSPPPQSTGLVVRPMVGSVNGLRAEWRLP